MKNDLKSIYQQSFFEGFHCFRRNLKALFALICITLAGGFLLLQIPLSLENTNGFYILAFYSLTLLLLTAELCIISSVVRTGTFSFRSSFSSFPVLFYKISNTLFFVLIFMLILVYLFITSLGIGVIYGALFVIFVILNPIPEIFYLRSQVKFPSIRYAAKFMQKMWIEWLLPNLLFFAFWGGVYALNGRILSPDSPFWVMAFISAAAQVFSFYFMIVRGYLFMHLDVKQMVDSTKIK